MGNWGTNMLLLQRSSLRHRIDFAEHLGISHRCRGSQGLRFCPLSECGHNTKSILPRMEMTNLTIDLGYWIHILYRYLLYIHTIYLHDFKEHHQASFCIHRVSFIRLPLCFTTVFIIRAEVFELNGVAKGPQQGVGHLNTSLYLTGAGYQRWSP